VAIDTHRRLSLDDVLVVDVDVHAHETADALAPLMDPQWRPAMENLRQVPRRYLDLPGFGPNHGPRLLGTSLPSPRGNREEIVWNAEQMRRELDAFSIDVGIIFPDHFLKLAALPRADYAAAIARAYHRWMHEQWLATDNDLYAVIMAIPQDPAEAAREIDRWAGEDRFAGIYLPTCQVYPLWGHRKYDPIYAAAQRHDLPVFFHAVSGSASGFPYNVEQFTTSTTAHTVSHVFAMMSNMMSILETGVPQRFPGVRFCFAEAGLTWLPFLRMRLDKEYNENRYAWPHFSDRPSKTMRGFYLATQPVEEPENRQDLVDIIRIYDGADTTTFASDWPHHDFDHPRAVFDLPVTDVMKRKLLGANALKLMPRVRVPVKYESSYRAGETL
jgi:uncharacterized protein